MIDIILTVHNQESIIKKIFSSIIENKSYLVDKIIIIFDGCSDNSECEIDKIYCDVPIIKIYADDVNEVKANNLGLKKSKNIYSLLIQDDMLIQEKNFDLRLSKPFAVVENLFMVSGRDAVNGRFVNNSIEFYDVAGKDANTSRNVFSIRQAVNRGPILIKNEILKKLNYLDEDFAPLSLDDVDLSFRALKRGYYVGSYVIDYFSDYYWGATRKTQKSNQIFDESEHKNMILLMNRHYDVLISEKNNVDIILE